MDKTTTIIIVMLTFSVIFSFCYIEEMRDNAKDYCKYFPDTKICKELSSRTDVEDKLSFLTWKQINEMAKQVRPVKQNEQKQKEKQKLETKQKNKKIKEIKI